MYKKFSWVNILIILLALFCMIYISFSILKPGFPSGHDAVTHLNNSKLFIEALNQGQFPVRWTEWILPGTSLPLFNFYQVGFYYLVAFFNSVFPLFESLKTAILLSWGLGTLFVFLFAKRLGLLSGIFAALIYAFTPYLISDVFVRGSYPEFLAINLFAGCLWAFDRLLVSGKPTYGIIFSLLSAGVLISHLPSVIILGPVLVGYYFLLKGNNEIKERHAEVGTKIFSGTKPARSRLSRDSFLKNFVPSRMPLSKLSISLVLAFGLSAFYLLPALGELNFIKGANLTGGYHDYWLHFVEFPQLFSNFWGYGFSVPGPNDGMSFQIGIIQLIIVALSLLFLLFGPADSASNRLKPHVIFWLLVAAMAVFFTLRISLSIWQAVPFMNIIQYPWRFLMAVSLATAYLSGILISLLRKEWHQIIIVIATVVAILFLYGPYLAPEKFLSESDMKKAVLEESYLPLGVGKLPDKDIKHWEIIKGDGKVEEKVYKNRLISFITQAEHPFVVRLNTHYFPGWKTYLDKQEVNIDRNNEYDFMDIDIPAGQHEVESRFTDTPIRTVGNILSAVSLLILGLWGIKSILLK